MVKGLGKIEKYIVVVAIILFFALCYRSPWKNFIENTPGISDITELLLFLLSAVFLVKLFFKKGSAVY